jgi:hypothetical protein
VPAWTEAPAIDKVSDEIQIVWLLIVQERQQRVSLCMSETKVQVAEEQASDSR